MPDKPADTPLDLEAINRLLDADRLKAAADATLGEAETVLLAEVEARAELNTAEAVTELTELANAVKALRAEAARRFSEAEERAQQRAAILADILPAAKTDPDPDPDPKDGDGDGEDPSGEGTDPTGDDPSDEGKQDPPADPTGTTEDPPADPTPEAKPDAKPEAKPAVAAAAAPSIATIRSRQPRDLAGRPRGNGQGRLAIVAAGGIDDRSPGSRMNADELGAALFDQLDAMRGSRHPGRRRVATLRYEYPEERTLHNSLAEDTRKIEAVTSPEAIIAAGGICAPTAPSYDIFGYGVDARPVRDALVAFRAERGGVTITRPPLLTTVDDGITIWTEANDQEPSDPTTKNIVTIDCPAEVEVRVDAVVARMQYGNFRARFWPEQVRRWLQLMTVAHARAADGNLLDSIAAGSTAVSDGQNLGATRDLLVAYGRAAAQMRSRHRLDPRLVIQVLMPAWVRDVIRADLVRQMPGDNAIARADAEIDGYFRAHNLAPSYYLDTETGTGQVFGAQPAGGLLAWQTSVVAYMWAAGTWLFLDGGTLDLGTEIRDSSLNDTNDAQTFMETFEEAVRVGVESLKITNTICIDGSAQALVDDSCPTPAS